MESEKKLQQEEKCTCDSSFHSFLEANAYTPQESEGADCPSTEASPFLAPSRKRKYWTEEEKKAFWGERKRSKKEAKRERKTEIERANQIEWDQLDEAQREERRQKAIQKHEERRQEEEARDRQCRSQLADPSIPRLVFDLSFAWCMTPGNFKSSVAQILFSYGTLRRAGFPFCPVITSLIGREADCVENNNNNNECARDLRQDALSAKNAQSTHSNSLMEGTVNEVGHALREMDSSFSPASKDRMTVDTREMRPTSNGIGNESVTPEPHPLLAHLLTCSAFKKYGCPIYIEEHWSSIFEKDKVVFLTADAENILETVERDTVYIIGAFVDHNQHKFLSMNAALRHGVRAARLPIKEHIDVRNRCQILTINHVVDVLTRFTQQNSWRDALEAALPVRRVHQEELGSRKKRRRVLHEIPSCTDKMSESDDL